ncbi:MAG: response regulator [Pirellulaceae bacterium]|jgi:two-component system phosphate regulon response regulator PhoB
MAKTRILIVEDDRSLGDILAYNLQREGYEIHRAVDGRDGLTQAQLKLPDIVLLDVMLPGLDGIEVCRQLRSNPETKELLVMMLTAKAEEADQLLGFHVGADDYVTKPFSVRVLMERIKALKRRTEELPDASGDVVARLGISVDRRRFKAMAGTEQLELTKSEFRLLDTLIRQPGRAFDRAELIDAALGGDTLVLVRTIDVHIRALRRKLGAHADTIETVRGVGYRFKEA